MKKKFDGTMKIAYVKKPFMVRIKEEKIPELGANEVLLKVKYCGICGYDILVSKTTPRYRRIGHEVSAEVSKMGSSVKSF